MSNVIQLPVTAYYFDWGIILVVGEGERMTTAFLPSYRLHRMDQRVRLTWREIREVTRIEGDFEVIRVQTMASNAVRVTLEMPEHMIPQMAMFAECQRNGIYLHGVFTASDGMEEKDTLEDW